MINPLCWFILPFCLASIIYYTYTIYAGKDFFTQQSFLDSDFTPPVSILKPLCGIETNAYENLASFVVQDYPQYQVIFCVREKDDPIIEVVRQLIRDFPAVDLSLVVSDHLIGNNFKISNLANGLKLAKYELLVIADSDILVDKNYLIQVVQPLQNEQVGVVTCLYQSLPEGWIAALDGIGIACDFFPSVLTARKLAGIKFAFGSTIVIRKQVLEAMGGFQAIANSLADDFLLGHLATQLGYQVILSNYIVKHQIGSESWRDFFLRQIRWFRCIRVERFWSYLGIIFTQGTINSLLFLLASGGSSFGWVLCSIILSLRLFMAYVVGYKYLQDPIAKQFIGLSFLSDLLRFIIWLLGLFGNTIEWRGKKLKLINGGRLLNFDTITAKNL
jgi:ceramide glucosyltransferase